MEMGFRWEPTDRVGMGQSTRMGTDLVGGWVGGNGLASVVLLAVSFRFAGFRFQSPLSNFSLSLENLVSRLQNWL